VKDKNMNNKTIEQEVQEIEQKRKMQKLAGINLQENSNESQKLYDDLIEGMNKFMELLKNKNK
jgi:dihydroorotate dehydrogenase